MIGNMILCLDTVRAFKLELRLDANCAHKATCRRSTSGGVVTCAGGAFFIVFLLYADISYALVYRNGLWPMESVRFSTCVSIVAC